ncbi:MAG: VOC family protein [Acidobacteriota bacterium]
MQTDQKIDYLEFPADDFDAVQAFYEKAFQWRFTDYGPEYRAFNDGKLDGGFHKSPLPSTQATGGVLVVLYARDLEQTLETVLASGGTIVKDPFAFPGGRRFHFADPHGNELAVWSDRPSE